jgi:hypothetical protein
MEIKDNHICASGAAYFSFCPLCDAPRLMNAANYAEATSNASRFAQRAEPVIDKRRCNLQHLR